jgi:hypothetical protein
MASLSENLSKEERKRLKAQIRAEKEKNTVIDPNSEITILCVRFGNRYGREYVERLRNMINRHMTIKHEIVCLTDDHHPIEGVRTIYQPNAGYPKGWWHKVHMFDSNLPLQGRILYFDLDIVIHDNIDKLAAYHTDQFVGIHDFNRKFYTGWKYLNSSVMAWNHRSQSHVWEQFKSNPKEAQKLQGDQDWIWKIAKEHIKFWPREWIQSYKWEIRRREDLTIANGKRNFKNTDHSIVPEFGCCVTVFHGDPKPQDVQDKFVIDNWR